MKNHITAAALALMLTGPLAAAAQTGDWQAVENLRPRTLISVEDMHLVIHDTCRFNGVVDGQLFCEYGPHLLGPSEIAFRQESIRAVRHEHNGTLIGLGIGAGAGAVFGAVRDPDPGIGRGGSAILGAGIYGGFGAIIGSAHGHFSHGKIIYQNPGERTKTSAAEAEAHLELTQFPGRQPRPPYYRGPYARPVYPQMWSGRPSGRHALVGAIIGGLLGAAVAAKGNAGGRSTFALTALGGGLGAGIGLSVPSLPSSFPGPQTYRHGWRDDREDTSRSNSALRPDPSVAEAQATGILVTVQ